MVYGIVIPTLTPEAPEAAPPLPTEEVTRSLARSKGPDGDDGGVNPSFFVNGLCPDFYSGIRFGL